MLGRSRSLQIYLKPGIKEDDLMLRVWESCRRHDRPQDVFRSMLRAGLMAMLESGEMPESVIEDCGLDTLLERRRSRARRVHEQQPQPMYAPPYAYPLAPAGHQAPPHWQAPQNPLPPQPAPGHAEPARPADVGARPGQEAKATPQDEAPDARREPEQTPKKPGKGRIGDLM